MVTTFKKITEFRDIIYPKDKRYHREISVETYARYRNIFIPNNPGALHIERLDDGKWISTVGVWINNFKGLVSEGVLLKDNGHYLTSDDQSTLDIFEQWVYLRHTPREPADPLAVFDIWD